MDKKFKTLISALIALSVVFSGAAFAASPGTVDGTTTDTADKIYVNDGDTIATAWNSSADEEYVIQMTGAASSDLSYNITVDGKEVHKFSGTWTEVNATAGEYNTSFDAADIADMPRGVNENVTMTVNVWEGTDKANGTAITAYVETDGTEVVQWGDENSSFVDIDAADVAFYQIFTDEHDNLEVDDTVTIDGDNTSTVAYYFEGDESLDALDFAAEDVDESGAFMFTMASLEGDDTEAVPVFYKSTPDWFDDMDDKSYAVYDPSANSLTYHLDNTENYEGETTADAAYTTDEYGIMDLKTVADLNGGLASSQGLSSIVQLVI